MKNDCQNLKISPRKPESNQNIFKLVDDTINFIDQELTKSYKQTNIGMKNNCRRVINEIEEINKNNTISQNIINDQLLIGLPKCINSKSKRRIPSSFGLRHSKTHKRLNDIKHNGIHSFIQAKGEDLLGIKFDKNNEHLLNFDETAEFNAYLSSRNTIGDISKVENKLVFGLKEISFFHSSQNMGRGATPSLNSYETPRDFYSKNKERICKLVKIYSEAMDGICKQNEAYRSVLTLIKKGFTDIINELFNRNEQNPYTQLDGRIQALEYHNKALEDKVNIYKEDVKDLEKRIIDKDKELDIKIEQSNKLIHEKVDVEEKLKDLRKKVIFTKECLRFESDAELLKACTTNGKAYSTRSYHTPSPVKKIKEIAVRKDFNLTICSKIEQNLLKFILYLENKGVPAIHIFKDEYLKLRDKKIITQFETKINDLKLDLFENDPKLLIDDEDYNRRIEYDYDNLVNRIHHMIPRHSNSLRNMPKQNNKKLLINRSSEAKHKEKESHIPCHRNSSEIPMKSRELSGSSNNRDQSNGRISFHSDDSFRPICSGPSLMIEKPSCVPVLDLKNLASYIDSDDDKFEFGKVNLAVPDYSSIPLLNQIYDTKHK